MADTKVASVTKPTTETEKKVRMVNKNKMNGTVGAEADVLASEADIWTSKGWTRK